MDEAAAVDLELDPGEIALFDNALCHSSKPNFGSDRRIVFLLEMIPTHAYQVEPRESAVPVRGVDTFGHFDVDPRPQVDLGAEELAAWERAVAIQASVLFRGANRPPRALRGMTSGAPPTGGA